VKWPVCWTEGAKICSSNKLEKEGFRFCLLPNRRGDMKIEQDNISEISVFSLNWQTFGHRLVYCAF